MIMFEYEPDLPLSNFGTKNINFINIVGLIELLFDQLYNSNSLILRIYHIGSGIFR